MESCSCHHRHCGGQSLSGLLEDLPCCTTFTLPTSRLSHSHTTDWRIPHLIHYLRTWDQVTAWLQRWLSVLVSGMCLLSTKWRANFANQPVCLTLLPASCLKLFWTGASVTPPTLPEHKHFRCEFQYNMQAVSLERYGTKKRCLGFRIEWRPISGQNVLWNHLCLSSFTRSNDGVFRDEVHWIMAREKPFKDMKRIDFFQQGKKKPTQGGISDFWKHLFRKLFVVCVTFYQAFLVSDVCLPCVDVLAWTTVVTPSLSENGCSLALFRQKVYCDLTFGNW